MLGFAKAQVMGNVTRDLELKQTSTGKSVVSFTIAVNQKSTDDTDFIDCTAWEQAAEILAKYVTKGKPILVLGKLKQQNFEHNGVKRSKIELIVQEFFFLGSGENQDRPLTQHEVLNAVNKDTVIEEFDDKPIDLSQIPF